jgi:alpha-L-fucosidase
LKVPGDYLRAGEQDVQRWRDMKFGLFVHWGPVSLKGTEIGWSRGAQVPIEEYDQLYKQFNPTKFDAEQWVRIAKEAGMKYMVITTKHHDGFCLWPSKYTDYDIGQTPFKRDVLKELSKACRRQGIRFGTYYSVCDWHHPDFPLGSPGGRTKKPNPNLGRYVEYLRNQVIELVQNYGPLSTMWFDVPQAVGPELGKPTVAMVRKLQPDILINNRAYRGRGESVGDYDTPEQSIGSFNLERPWETCMTIGGQWAWKPNDQIKSLRQCLQTLVRVVGGDGNFLFNVGPMPTGAIEPRQIERLKEMGVWLSKYGQSIYATRGGPFKPGPWGASTHKDNRIYVHIFNWQGESIKLPAISKKIVADSVLTGGTAVVKQTKEGIEISVPKDRRRDIDTIVVLELDGPAGEIAPVGIPSSSLAYRKKAQASNVFRNMQGYGPDKAFDDDDTTRWATDGGTPHQAWLAVDLGKPTTFNRAVIHEGDWDRVRNFELQYKADGKWQSFYHGIKLGDTAILTFEPVTARYVRLNILQATEGPTIWEFRLFAPEK